MKPQPAPPGNTAGERMSNALRTVLSVSKEDLVKEEALLKRTKDRKQSHAKER
jgi:hypothetical protein